MSQIANQDPKNPQCNTDSDSQFPKETPAQEQTQEQTKATLDNSQYDSLRADIKSLYQLVKETAISNAEYQQSNAEYQQTQTAEMQTISTCVAQLKSQLTETYTKAVEKAAENTTLMLNDTITTYINPLKDKNAILKAELEKQKSISNELQQKTH